MPRGLYLYASKNLILLKIGVLWAASRWQEKEVRMASKGRPDDQLLKMNSEISRIFGGRPDATLFPSRRWAVQTFLFTFQTFKLYYSFLAFQRHQFRLNPILEQRVMIKTLRRMQKSSWKPEKRPDGVALPPGRLLFPDPCLTMKSNFYLDSK
jgi:hypothetical protein